MAGVARNSRQKRMTYIRDIPLLNRQKLCKILDVPGPGANWKTLAAYLDFTADDCYSFEKAYFQPGGSPADEMLKVWDFGNHTVMELYNKLCEIKHARGMMLLKDFVDAAHKEKIKKIQGDQQPVDSHVDHEVGYHPHRRRQPEEDIDTSGKLHGPQPSNIQQGGSFNGHSSEGHSIPNSPANANQPVNKEAEACAAEAQSSWNEPQRSQNGSNMGAGEKQRPPQFNEQDVVRRNLDGGTQKHINSPLMRPPPSYNTDGTKLSDDNNPTSSNATACTDGAAAKKPTREEKEKMQKLTSLSAVMTMKYEDIQRATQNFSDSYKLGSGSFGTVYYMVYVDTKYAIKRLHPDDDPNASVNVAIAKRKSLMKEITTLATYRHPRIVTLCFYCTDGPEPCLVYEYLQNGSLEDNLQCRGPHKQPLGWEQRNKIALDAAIGLRYLHNAQDQAIIHGDIKSANILLDETFKPKIGDFGLARYGPDGASSQTILKTSRAYGTLPYLPRDFLSSLKLSVKVDVYSFGIVLMEILTGEKAADEKREPQNKWLYQIVVELVDRLKNEEGFERKLVDELLDKRCSDWPWDLAWQMLELALQCVYVFPQRRPEMKEVVKKLQEINDRIEERNSLKKRSLPTQNTEPLPGGQREPEESCFDSSELPVQDPRITPSAQEQNTADLSPVDRRIQDMRQQQNTANVCDNMGQQQNTTHMTALERKLREVELSSPPAAANNLPVYTPNPPFRNPGGHQEQYRPPRHSPQDLRSDFNTPGHGGQVPSSTPQQSFPTGTSSTVPSSYMNRPTPPSTATNPSTNPPVYDFPDDRRYNQAQYTPENQYRGYQQPNTAYPAGESHQRAHYPQNPYDMHPHQQRFPQGYIQQQYPPQYQDGGYSTQQQQQQHQYAYHPAYRQYREPYLNESPPRYANFDPMVSINPANFTAMPPTPSPDVYSGMHDGQMAKIDRSQLPGEYTHKGPDLNRVTSTESRNTPLPARVAVNQRDDHSTHTSSTIQQQQSYVHFPEGMHQLSHDAGSEASYRAPMQQTDVLPDPGNIPQAPVNSSEEANHTLASRRSPMPSQNTDIISPMQQVHGVTTDSTDTQELEPPQPGKSADSWTGERVRPMATQHTDKIPTQELSTTQELFPSNDVEPSATAGSGEKEQYQSAPPDVGRTVEDASYLSMGSRVPTQMTEPLQSGHRSSP